MNKRRYKPLPDRGQKLLPPDRTEDCAGRNHPVRALDACVDSLDLEAPGFTHAETGTAAGHPPCSPRAMLKLYLYGYQHGIRGSRKLEAETRRNTEATRLPGKLAPSYKSIADFRRRNAKRLKEVNRDFALLCAELSLFGGGRKRREHTDGVLREQGGLEEMDRKTRACREAVDTQDAEDDRARTQDGSNDKDLAEKIEKLRKIQADRKALLASAKSRGDSVVDDKRKLAVVGQAARDCGDHRRLSGMLGKAEAVLGVEKLSGLADGGCYESGQLKECEENNITAYAAVPDRVSAMKRKGRYAKKDFVYDAEGDVYRCPQAKLLRPTETVSVQSGKTYTRYVSGSGKCVARESCLSAKARTRMVYRWEREEVIERHDDRMRAEGPEKTRKRSMTAEHVFGTLKCRNGPRRFLTRERRSCGSTASGAGRIVRKRPEEGADTCLFQHLESVFS